MRGHGCPEWKNHTKNDLFGDPYFRKGTFKGILNGKFKHIVVIDSRDFDHCILVDNKMEVQNMIIQKENYF